MPQIVSPSVPSAPTTITERYDALVASGTIERDPAKEEVVAVLDALAHRLKDIRQTRFGLARLFDRTLLGTVHFDVFPHVSRTALPSPLPLQWTRSAGAVQGVCDYRERPSSDTTSVRRTESVAWRLDTGPVPRGRGWLEGVNRAMNEREVERIRRGKPYGDEG